MLLEVGDASSVPDWLEAAEGDPLSVGDETFVAVGVI